MLAVLMLKGSKCLIVSAKTKRILHNADVIFCPTVRWQANYCVNHIIINFYHM